MPSSKDEIEAGMEGLLIANKGTPRPESIKGIMSKESNDDLEFRRSIEFVEKRLLSFYEHQLEQPHQEHAKHRVPSAAHKELPIHKTHAYPCQDTHKSLPSHPSLWPQGPIMLRPTPNTNTRIRGIRRADSTEYQYYTGFCAGCILPINTGKELPGSSLMIDFESKYFVGTVLMRIKDAPCVCEEGTDSYFDDKKRRFQAIVKGIFKAPLKMSECVTGQVFTRPAGSLPARWIVTSFVKFVSTLAPQLEASIDGEEPRFLTPLVATAHTVLEKPVSFMVKSLHDDEKDERLHNFKIYAGSRDMEAHIEEPPADDSSSLMKHVPGASLSDAGSVARRQKARKRAFNKISAHHADEPCFQLDKEYSFEFYQHLLLFGDSLAIDMGRPIGQVNLAPITDGQPIKFMSAYKDPVTGELDDLWSFDIWHESLYQFALDAEDEGAETTEH